MAVSTPAAFHVGLLIFWCTLSFTCASPGEEMLSPRFLAPLNKNASWRKSPNVEKSFDALAIEINEAHDLRDILAHIGRQLGDEFKLNVEDALPEIKAMLLPVFVASPKNQFGKLDDAPARYALRRVLMERNGWDVPSLGEDELEEAADLNTSLMLGYSLPSPVRGLLQRRVLGRGAGMLDLSVFVATLEAAAAQDVTERLKMVYWALQVPQNLAVEQAKADEIIDLHMGSYICGEDLSHMSPSRVFKFQTDLPSTYNQWTETQQFFRHMQQSIVANVLKFTFENLTTILRQIQKEFVFWNNRQCADLKHSLMGMELQGSGRVRLLDFYDGAVHKGIVQFRETKEYLRALGALDESDPLEPRVIMSNYLDGPSNCVAETDHYSMCCIDECGDLYSYIEHRVGRPEAPAEEIIAIVKHLASSTMQRGRLSNAILRRIHDIADNHEGFVPLHGPLFAEWMHFAYPRECTYPQMFGPAHAKTLTEWEIESGRPAGLTDAEIFVHIGKLEELDIQRLARAKAINDSESNLAESCWTWDAAEVNITFDEEQPPPMTPRRRLVVTPRWAASAFCFMSLVLYIGRLLCKQKSAKGF